MPKAVFRFYEELNDYLPPEKRKTDFEAEFKRGASVEEVIEDLGAPSAEVDLLLVNGEPADPGYRLQDGDRVSVYPVFETLDIGGVTLVRKRPLREIRFIADVHLGNMAAHMRSLGYDVTFDPALSRDGLIAASNGEKRTILTEDPDLLKSREVTRAICLPKAPPSEQVRKIREVLNI